MELLYLSDKNREEADAFVASRPDGAELAQSWQWGELMEKEGAEIIRVGVRANGKIVAVALFIKKPIGGGVFYWYAPRGPLGESAAVGFLLAEFATREKKALFFRIEPEAGENVPPRGEIFSEIIKTLPIQPAKTLFLDLSSREEELSAALHQKTRYNIRLAEKKGVEIITGGAGELSEFWRLISLTGERDGFRPHGRKHYQNMLASDADFIKLFLARYQGKNIAAGLFGFWGGRATYLHGASDNEFRNVMAPYLLQWTAIKAARAAACRYYDFYGIDEKKWPGVTRFKLGFGGFVREYPGTFDLITRPAAYRLYNFLRRLRRLI
jgi:lipid II:glycine glycyltransferase (peptidoglycan interpeptide bridge formation enzyme)